MRPVVRFTDSGARRFRLFCSVMLRPDDARLLRRRLRRAQECSHNRRTQPIVRRFNLEQAHKRNGGGSQRERSGARHQRHQTALGEPTVEVIDRRHARGTCVAKCGDAWAIHFCGEPRRAIDAHRRRARRARHCSHKNAAVFRQRRFSSQDRNPTLPTGASCGEAHPARRTGGAYALGLVDRRDARGPDNTDACRRSCGHRTRSPRLSDRRSGICTCSR